MIPSINIPGLSVNPLVSISRHFKAGLLAMLLVIAVGLPVVWIKGQSVYSAEAVFQVAPRYMKNVESDQEVELQSNSQYRQFVNQLQNTVLRYDVIDKALDQLLEQGLDTRPSGLTRREYIERLQRSILTLAIPDTYMVRVRLQGGPDDQAVLHEIVNAVMTSFIETSKNEQIYGSAERYLTLNENRENIRRENETLNERRAQLARSLGLTTFRDGVTNPYDSILARLRETLTNAIVERERAEAAHQAFVERGEIPTEYGRSLLDLKLGDTQLNNLRTTTHERITRLQQELYGLGPKHPARAPAERQIRVLEEQLMEAENEFDRTTYANFEARLKASVEQYSAVEEGIRENVTAMESQASEFARLFQEAMNLTRTIDENNRRAAQIQERMNYLEMESDAIGFVRLVTPALPAEMPMGIGKKKLLIVLMIAAFGIAIAVPIGLDFIDPRIRSVKEAEKKFGTLSAGWQIEREDLPTRLFADELSRRFAATLIRNRSRTRRGVYAFTSVKLQGGSTTTVLDTARTLKELGASVLVVEANSFTPSADFATFGPGLSDLLRETSDYRQSIRPHVHRGTELDAIGIGTRTGTGLQRLDRLRPMLEDWARDYEYVLFDLPPVLLSADAEMLIEILGQVFLVVECESVSKDEIVRARQLLQKIDPEAVGLFVSRVPLYRGGLGGDIEESLIETLTRSEFKRFDAGAYLGLQLQLMRTRWALRRKGRRSRTKQAGDDPSVAKSAPRGSA